MPRNGAGSYSLPAGSTITNGDVSDASDLNTPLADIAADLNVARPIVAGGTGATSAAAARTNLGLAIGANVQAYDATLASLAALGTAADRFAYTTGVDTWAEAAISAFGRQLIDDADAATARTTLGLGAAATAGFLDEDAMTSDSATAAPSQQSVKAYVDAGDAATAAKGFGVGQTIQDVSGSRVAGTSYQNTTGRTIEVIICADGGGRTIDVSANNATWVQVGIGYGSSTPQCSFPVPSGWYYRLTGTGTIRFWAEMR